LADVFPETQLDDLPSSSGMPPGLSTLNPVNASQFQGMPLVLIIFVAPQYGILNRTSVNTLKGKSKVAMGLEKPHRLTAGLAGHCQPDKKVHSLRNREK